MSTNMKAELCVQTLDNAMASYPALRGAIIHSDCGAQYTSDLYRRAITRYGIRQSMNRVGGRCHDNARCESMWASEFYLSTDIDNINFRCTDTVQDGQNFIVGKPGKKGAVPQNRQIFLHKSPPCWNSNIQVAFSIL